MRSSLQTTFVTIAYASLAMLAVVECQPIHAVIYLALAIFHHHRGRPPRRN